MTAKSSERRWNAQPHQVITTLDFAAIYHELGHDVFQRFPEIARALAKTVSEYYSELKQSAGAMAPDKRRTRDEAIENAKGYWIVERLNEIFSDIYVTFACGPAHYFSCVDVAMRLEGNPFSVNLGDVHPPWAARVHACEKTLLPAYQGDQLVSRISRVWDTYQQAKAQNPHFDLLCPRNLIECLVEIAVQNIEKFLPQAKRYSAALDALIPEQGASLEMLLNERVRVLLTDPGQYQDWEKNVFEILKANVLEAKPLP